MAKAMYIGGTSKAVEHKVLEYIESTGTQYIDTGFKPNQNTRVVMNCEVLGFINSKDMFLYGARVASGNTGFYCAARADNASFAIGYANQSAVSSNLVGIANHTVDQNKNSYQIDSVSGSFTASTFQSSYNLHLFACITAGTVDATQVGKLKVHSCQIYDNGTLIRDFVPVKHNDGKIGLYDKINKVFYSNGGTGSFNAGGETGETITITTSKNNVALNVKKIYIGVNGVARKVKKGYIGVNGIARLFYTGFPDEPTEYTLVVTYTASDIFVAPADGWYQIELQGASGKGGNAWTDESLRKIASGGGGGGGACAISRVKLNKDDTVVVGGSVAVGGTLTVTINSSTEESYDVMSVTSGTGGGNGAKTYGGAAGTGGTATGGNYLNANGGNGRTGRYTPGQCGFADQTLTGAAGGAAGYEGGNVGGQGGSATWHGSNASYFDECYATTTGSAAGKTAFVKIYGGNTN